MPRYYCDYCDTYLTHDSPSVRKQHNAGYKHKANVRNYYQQFEEQQTQRLIDERIKEHLGHAAAFQQVGAAYSQHLASMPGGLPRPRLPLLPTPLMPMPGGMPGPFIPGLRPPILPRPIPGVPGYGTMQMMPPNIGPPGAPYLVSRPPPSSIPFSSAEGGAPGSDGGPPTGMPLVYQSNNPIVSTPNSSEPTSIDGFS